MKFRAAVLLCAAVGVVACGSPAAAPAQVTFGVIGDFGVDGTPNLNVSNMVKGWNPGFIVTTGDNNYNDGASDTIDDNIGKYYASYIGNYTGAYGPGSASNRFFPSLGNHDWGNFDNNPTGADPYKAYFTLPGNERYYDVAPDNGPVRIFVIDSDRNEPDSVSSHGIQGQWLKQRLAESTEPFKLIAFHHAGYSSSSNHGSNSYMQWPFAQWGATAVLTGHDHQYERLNVAGIPHFVNGVGGNPFLYGFNATPEPGSQFRYNANHGAMKVTASGAQMTFDFYSIDGMLHDSLTQARPLSVPSVTRSFQEGIGGYSGGQDTYVDASQPTLSFGNDSRGVADGDPLRQGLIRFDNLFGSGANQIPAGSYIQYANLRIVTGGDEANNDQSPNAFGLHRMLTSWSESSTWNSMTGGINLGSDAVATADGLVEPEYINLAMNFDVTATVQGWVDGATSNFGWAIVDSNGTDGWRFVTSETSVLANRPALEISYIPPTIKIWKANADGNWSASTNWLGGAPGAAGVAALFTGAITSAHTVTVDSPRTIGRIEFDNASSYTIAGTSTLTIDGGASAGEIKVTSGSHTISAPISLAGNLSIQVTPAASTLTISSDVTATAADIAKLGAGTLVMKNVRASGLTISSGTLSVAANGSAAGLSKINTLSIAVGAALDLADNDLIVGQGDFAAIRALVVQGFGNATGITSSTSDGSQSLALFDNTFVGASDWMGLPITAGAIVGKYTYFGDMNIDGQVSGDDYTVIDANLNTTPPAGLAWLCGDANLDGVVSGDDYTVIDANLGLGAGSPLQPARVPEPCFAIALAPLCLGLRRRKPA